MNNAGALASLLGPRRLTPRLVLDAWRGITLAQIGITFLLGCAYNLVNVATGLALPGGGVRGWSFTFVSAQILAFSALLAFVVADKVTGQDPDRRGPYALAIIVGPAVTAPLAVAWVTTMLTLFVRPAPYPGLGFVLYVLLQFVLFGGAAVWIINDRRRAQRAREHMHRAEIERIEAEKRSIESDLQAMQARVEPRFLFNTLAQVRELYRVDATRGQWMLDELIAYLRAAMPRMRDTSSTVAQELELARAYLAIVKVRFGDRLDYAIEAVPDTNDARMPPMIVLPLVAHAVTHTMASSEALGAICLTTALRDDRLQLIVAYSAAGLTRQSADEEIVALRERLDALYDGAARIDMRLASAGGTEVFIELPRVHTPSIRGPAEWHPDGAEPSHSAGVLDPQA